MTFATSPYRIKFVHNTFLVMLCVLFACIWIWSLLHTSDAGNWVMENSTVALFVAALIYSYAYFKFSDLSYLMFFAFLLLHLYGSQYSYPQNPLGEWVQALTGSARNPYDRIVHFCFGLLLAYPMRELSLNYIKTSPTLSWIMPLVFSLAFGAFYEVIEWLLATNVSPRQSADFLGMQNDSWDAQKDMVLAFVGSFCGVTLISICKKFAVQKKYGYFPKLARPLEKHPGMAKSINQ
jgi:putative membrane protein